MRLKREDRIRGLTGHAMGDRLPRDPNVPQTQYEYETEEALPDFTEDSNY